jgi:hypothetical protein
MATSLSSIKKPQSVFELFKHGKLYEHVITVCHDTESKCAIFPDITKRWHRGSVFSKSLQHVLCLFYLLLIAPWLDPNYYFQ